MEEKNNKTQIILLTVIGLVTMIVVVIGATFAYLASTIESENTANINASTSAGSDMLLFDTGGDINLLANTENFGPENGNLTSTIDASVVFQTTQNTSTEKYTMYMDVGTNDFEYSSGSCYVKSTEVQSALSKDACLNANDTNLWATTDGTNYACYGASDVVTGSYSNQLSCLLNSNYMWVVDNSAELVMDVYATVDAADESACIASGVCVDSVRAITNDTAENCSAANGKTWLTNMYDNGICYQATKTYDLTGYQDDDTFTIYNEVTINASAGYPVTNNYRIVTTLINFNHNQIINGNKKFEGTLTIARVTE